MSERETVTSNNAKLIGRNITNVDVSNFIGLPLSIYQKTIEEEIAGIYGQKLLSELVKIIGYYDIYDNGVQFMAEGSNGDYVAADLKYAQTADLINKEARFMFGTSAETTFKVANPDEDNEDDKKAISVIQSFFDTVADENAYADKCLKGYKDGCIGGRIAVAVDFIPNEGIFIKFLPAYCFIHDYDEYERLNKLITFHTIVDSDNKNEQRIYRKKWEMVDGFCYITISTYDGMGLIVKDENGELMEEVIQTRLDFFPCWVILNDGLTGDMDGESEVKRLSNYEGWYSKLANADIDSARQNMNPIRYTTDMSPESLDNLSTAAGAFWDLASNTELKENVTGSVGVLETNMSYSQPLSNTLSRLESRMHKTLDIPDISLESMQGVVTSGKALKAIYWPLSVRCDEKMIAWEPALRFIAIAIIEGAKLYPDAAKVYMDEPIPEIEYKINIENPYSLPEDHTEERSDDIRQVQAQTMSRKTFIKKWHQVTDKEAEKELEQILKEKTLFDESGYTQAMVGATNTALSGYEILGDEKNIKKSKTQVKVEDFKSRFKDEE